MGTVLQRLSLYLAGLTGLGADTCSYGIVVAALAVTVALLVLAVLIGAKWRSALLGLPLSFEKAQAPWKSPAPLFWTGRWFPEDQLRKHLAICGTTRSGKSLLLSLFLRSVISQITPGSDRRLVLFDLKNAHHPALFDDVQVPVHFFLPNHRLTSRWDLAGGDFASPVAVRRLCDALVPQLQGDDGSTVFFAQAVRALMGGVIRSLNATQPGWSLADVIRILDDRDATAEVFARRTETRSLLCYMTESRTYAAIAATMAARLGPLRDLAGMWSQASQVFSLRDFLQREGILVLGRQLDFPGLDLLNTLLLTQLFSELLTQSDSSTRRTYLVFDVADDDRPLPGLKDLCLRGPSRGVVIAATFRSYGEMKALYKDDADVILAMLQNRIFLRAGDVETARYASQAFGKTREWDNVSSQDYDRDVVPYHKFLALPPTSPQGGITGYWLSPPPWCSSEPFHLPGSWIAANLPRPASRARTF